MNDNGTPTRSAREICAILFRHKKKAFTLALLVLALTTAVVIYYPRTYASEAKLFVRVGRESVALDPTATQGQTTYVQKSYEQEINSVMEILNSRMLAERVVKTVGSERILQSSGGPKTLFSKALSTLRGAVQDLDPISDEERALLAVQKATTIFVPKDSGVVIIRSKADSPKTAQVVVAALVETFQAEHIRVSRTRGSHLFFSEQAEQQQRRLDEAYRELRDAKNRDGVVTIEGQRSLLLDQIGRVEDDLMETQVAVAFSEARVADLQQTVDKMPANLVTDVQTGIGNDATARMRQQLYALEILERQHGSKYTAEHPVVQAIADQRKQVKEIYDAQPPQRTHVTKGINSSREELRVQLLAERATLAALNAKESSLKQHHRTLDKQLETVNNNEGRLAHLQRQVDLGESNYRKYLENLEQTRINQALQTDRISSINTIQDATFSETPISPSKMLVVVAGLFLSVFLPVALAFLCEYFDHTFTTATQVERELGVPVLVSIPRTSKHRVRLN